MVTIQAFLHINLHSVQPPSIWLALHLGLCIQNHSFLLLKVLELCPPFSPPLFLIFLSSPL